MNDSKYNKSVFLFIILVLMVLIAYTIVSLMAKEEVSVVDSYTNSVESITDVSNQVLKDIN